MLSEIAKRSSKIQFIRSISLFCCLTLSFSGCVESLHRRFTPSELLQTFGVQKPEHVPEYSLIETHRDRNFDGTLRHLRFNVWNTTYVIELEPNKRLISPHLTTTIRDGKKTSTFAGLPPNVNIDCHFHGRVVSHNNIKAAISDCQKLMGVIVHDDHFLMLQTIPQRLHTNEQFHSKHIVYKREAALINPLEHFVEEKQLTTILSNGTASAKKSFLDNNEVDNEEFCDISNVFHINYTLPSEAKLDSLFIFPQLDPITLEIGLFLDSQLYEHFRREFTADPDQHLTDFSLALINNVHVLYQQPTLTPNLDIVIVHFEMWKTQPPPLATELHKNGQAQTLLDSFCRHQARINPGTDLTDPGHWDHAVLLTGYDIYHTTASVAGVAPVGRMCDDLFACSLVEGLHLGRSFVLAHEMGHNMGMVHDGVQNQCGRSCCLVSQV
ncbi:reprolysin family propeptide domain-containing protein [Ditylenchus destructor]|nr:reprolysin family propeptide domain-containing protein [Ditylenchus destructor]